MSLLEFNDLKPSAEEQTVTPPQLPVRIRDLDLSPLPFDMDLPMGDGCPQCGGFNMKVGDYICWGYCYRCFEAENKNALKPTGKFYWNNQEVSELEYKRNKFCLCGNRNAPGKFQCTVCYSRRKTEWPL